MGKHQGRMEPRPDASMMRISDADRQRVAEVLRDAAGDGRIDLDELDERLELTWRAKTYADLEPVTADLGRVAPHSPPGLPVPTGASPSSSTAIIGDCKRQGTWLLPTFHRAVAVIGDVVLDLRQATFESRECTIRATAVIGDVKLIVPAHVQVVVDGLPVLGDFGSVRDKVPAEVTANSPVVRLLGAAVMGDVTVQRLPAPGTRKKFFGTY